MWFVFRNLGKKNKNINKAKTKASRKKTFLQPYTNY